MDFLKNLFGGDGKSDYTERIPDTLSPGNFSIHPTFQHGFLSQPSCLAYDSVQQLLSIGSHRGNIAIIGKSGLERHFTQPNHISVLQLLFVENKGHLISRCNNNTIYLWDIKSKTPFIKHKLAFQREVPSLMTCSYQSEWFFVGMEGGNVHIVQKEEFEISGYNIPWNKVLPEGAQRNRPGDVIGIQEHPLDSLRILLAFDGGLCTLWNLKTKSAEKRFKLAKSNLAILMCIAWHGSGKQFAGSYSDGSIAIFNIKSEGKPERVFHPHGSVPGNSPIHQLQWILTDPEPVFVFSGGFPDSDGIGVKSLTIHNTKNTNMLTFEDSIIQFLSLPSSPFISDSQKLFAVAVLTENELIVHDLQTHGFPTFNIPYSFDINYSPVSAIGYYGNCPDDFAAELQSVLTKLPQKLKSTKRWPMTGGKWGRESPDPWTDLVITGHIDGCVRLWYCRSVVMQPLFTIDTSSYLKQSQKNTSRRSSKSKSEEEVPLPGATPTNKSKGPHKFKTINSDDNLTATNRSKGLIPRSKYSSQEEVTITTHPSITTPTSNTKHSPILGKSKADNSPLPAVVPPEKSSPPKRKPTFRNKVLAGIGKKVHRQSSKTEITEQVPEEVDQETTGGVEVEEKPGATPPLPTQSEEQVRARERPTLLLPTDKQLTTPKEPASPMLPIPSTPSSVGGESSSLKSYNTTSREYTPPEITPGDGYTVLSLTCSSAHPTDNSIKGSSVHYLHMEPHAETLCLATYGGHVLCMDFSLRPVDRPPQSLQINFVEDSVIKPDEDVDGAVGGVSLNYQFDYMFTNEIDKQLPGFHVFQHCLCYYGKTANVYVTDLRYNMQKNILVIGSDCGLSVVDTGLNQCLKTLGDISSILYLSDPSSYSRQCRKIVEERFHSDHGSKASESPDQSDRRKGKDVSAHLLSPLLYTDQHEESTNDNMSKELIECEQSTEEQLVTCVEIVQMFVNKTGDPSLTLWVGTKGGRVCVYIINTMEHSRQSKIELLPTAIILELKSFVVDMLFLSEWGERLVNPYTANSDKSPTVIFRRSVSAKGATETEKPVNYAVITLRDKIKCVGFPVNQVISKAEPNLSNGFIVGSDFFACEGLPCIASWTSSGLILVHSLPGLKPMLQTSYTPFLNYRDLYSFKVSRDGQAVHQTTPTQLQRLSLLKANHLNLPHCLPDMFVPKEEPQPLSRGIIHTLFKQGSTMDRDALFEVEAAGKAWRSVAKKDECLEHNRPKQGKAVSTGATNAFEEAKRQLDQRGKDLSELEQQTQQLQDDASDFADVSRLLVEKQKRKKIF